MCLGKVSVCIHEKNSEDSVSKNTTKKQTGEGSPEVGYLSDGWVKPASLAAPHRLDQAHR